MSRRGASYIRAARSSNLPWPSPSAGRLADMAWAKTDGARGECCPSAAEDMAETCATVGLPPPKAGANLLPSASTRRTSTRTEPSSAG